MDIPKTILELANRIVSWVDGLQGREMSEEQIDAYSQTTASTIKAYLEGKYNTWYTNSDLAKDLVSGLISEIDGYLPEDVAARAAQNVQEMFEKYESEHHQY